MYLLNNKSWQNVTMIPSLPKQKVELQIDSITNTSLKFKAKTSWSKHNKGLWFIAHNANRNNLQPKQKQNIFTCLTLFKLKTAENISSGLSVNWKDSQALLDEN